MSKHLTPYDVVEHMIGRPEAVAAAIGRHPKSPYRWRKGSDNRDTGDIPGARIMRALLAHAAAQGLPLTADHLIWGAPEAEIAALMRDYRATRPGRVAA